MARRDLKDWIQAKKRYRLSDAHIAMARELGLNPRKFGSISNHDQEPWKAPLPQFLEELYARRFGRPRPLVVRSLEELARGRRAKEEERKQRKRLRREARKRGEICPTAREGTARAVASEQSKPVPVEISMPSPREPNSIAERRASAGDDALEQREFEW